MTAVTTERVDGVALIRIDRPRANALSIALLAELEATLAGLAAEPPGAVIVTGTERVFSAGADITEFTGPESAAAISRAFEAALSRLADLPRATFAAIRGPALGGGLELALACDFRVVAHSSLLGQPEVLLGIIPGGGATQRLPRLVGVARAKELIYTGRQIEAGEALRIGLVDRVVAADEVLPTALGLAAELARGPVVAHGLAKAAIERGFGGSLADGIRVERECFVDAFSTEDAAAGVRSFLEKGPGKAGFRGR